MTAAKNPTPGGPTTGILNHPVFAEHTTAPGHPERAERLTAILARLRDSGLWDELDPALPEPASLDAIQAVHRPAYVRELEMSCTGDPRNLNGLDTWASKRSFEAARLAAGAVMQACDGVINGTWGNATVVARPPGHHAEETHAMGFCLFNNVAIAARHLRAKHGLERVAIVDWDVHHGNGTQHTFEHDSSVFFASLHQFPHYPGTGAASERGLGDGEGATLNCPMPAGSGDLEWSRVFEQRVLPALEDFAPQFVLVSAGFDAHVDDPLSGTLVTEDTYRELTRALLDLARRHAHGRLVSTLEGGYNLESLASSMHAHVEALVSS